MALRLSALCTSRRNSAKDSSLPVFGDCVPSAGTRSQLCKHLEHVMADPRRRCSAVVRRPHWGHCTLTIDLIACLIGIIVACSFRNIIVEFPWRLPVVPRRGVLVWGHASLSVFVCQTAILCSGSVAQAVPSERPGLYDQSRVDSRCTPREPYDRHRMCPPGTD